MSVRSIHKENSKDWWNEKYQGAEWKYGKAPSEFLISVMDKFPKGARILDVGCGEGRNAVALAAKGFKVTGLDFSSVALERAAQLAKDSGVEVQLKSVDLDLFLPELMAFDVILCVNIKPAKTFLSNVSRGLAQHGFMVMEAHLLEACKTNKELETFECFAPNELLRQFVPSQASFRILKYSELDPGVPGDKVFLVAQKSQLF